MIKELTRKCTSGYLMLVILPLLNILDGWLIYRAIMAQNVFGTLFAVIAFVVILRFDLPGSGR